MNWKYLLTTISLSSIILSACGTNDDTAMNNAARTNQDKANLRTVGDDTVGNNNRRISTNVSDNNAYWNGTSNDRTVDNYNIDNQVSRDFSNKDITNRDGHDTNRWINNPTSNVQNRPNNVAHNRLDENRRITATNRIKQQNRDFTARNIANNTADNDQNRNGTANRNKMDVADRAAEKITQMREVARANVIVTNHNAYVAAKLADNADKRLTSDVEKRISDLVKASNREIDHVYVSVNPDFYKRTTSYAEDIRDGQPVEGFFDEFGELTRRLFPTEG